MAITSTQRTEIVKATVAMFGAAPGGYMTELTDLFVANGSNITNFMKALATTTAFTNQAAYSNFKTIEEKATSMASAYGLTDITTAGSAGKQAYDYFVAQLTANVNIGEIFAAANSFLASTTDTAFTTTKTLLTNKAAVAEYYTVDLASTSTTLSTLQATISSVTATTDVSTSTAKAAVINSTSAATTGTTYTLTSGIDTVTGTSYNDTFVAQYSETAASNYFGTTDTISGGAGTDTLSLTVLDYTDNAAISTPTVSGLEVVNFRAVDATATDNVAVVATNFGGMTDFNSDRSTSEITITALAAGQNVGVIGNGSVTNGDLHATYGATVTAGTLNISNGTTAGAIDMNGAGLTSLTINSTGSANTVGAVASTGTQATTTINATTALTMTSYAVANATTGTQSLVISGTAADVAASATAAAHSAVVLGAMDTDIDTINASGMTTGGVSLTLSATTTATFTGGAGNDTVTTSTSGQTGAVNAGAGTDTLVLANSADISDTTEGALYAGFETLGVSNAVSIDMDLITASTITALSIADAAGTTVVTDMNATQAAHVTLTAGAGAMTLGIKNATTVGTLDTLAITVSDGDTTSSEAVAGTGDWTIAGIETINITATDDMTLASMANISGLTSLTVSGAGDVAITTGAHVASANESVNFSALTTAATFNFSGTTTNAVAFTGGSAADTVTDSAIGGNVLTTGAGNDVIALTDKTSGTSATSVTGGAGADTVTVSMLGNVARDAMMFVFAAGDSVSGTTGTGISATLTDTITGFDGATLSATAGTSATIDTEKSATAVTTAANSFTLGTSTVTNANDFYVNIVSATVVNIYQDTDGDKIIEAGEFAVTLTGIATDTMLAADFTISSGNLAIATT